MSSKAAIAGNVLWQKTPKANAEFFALTYGALVAELVRDVEQPALIAGELDTMGHSMGMRAMEEFLAKTDTRCSSFETSPDVMTKALKMFLGISADARWKSAGDNQSKTYGLQFTDNPLTLFVELPDEYADLEYNQLLAGFCRGLLEMLQFDCSTAIAQSMLAGDTINEITVSLNQVLEDGAGEDYQEE